MRAWVNVARYHLVQRGNYLVLPWVALGLAFAVNLAIVASVRADVREAGAMYTGAIATIFVIWFVTGLLTTTRSLPFGLSLGVTRRSYYLGSAGLGVALAVGYGLAIAILQAVERASGGWGERMHFFRVPVVLDGPWYLTWLTAIVLFALSFCYGMWLGLVYRRWNVRALLAVIAAQVAVLSAGVLAASGDHEWHRVGAFFTALGAGGLTGALAGLTAVLVVGGLVTVRRLTVH